MATPVQQGYFLLARITGLPVERSCAELEHAYRIQTELLELLVEHLKPALTIAKLEGEAVFAYAPLSKIPRGEILLDLMDKTHAAFRARQASMRRSVCGCAACSSLPELNLQFIVHRGEFVIQSISGIRELVGTDVNLVHRLTKNRVAATTDWCAYALLTRAALDGMNAHPSDMHTQAEVYDLGEVQTFSLNLEAAGWTGCLAQHGATAQSRPESFAQRLGKLLFKRHDLRNPSARAAHVTLSETPGENNVATGN
jgi:hypothetical protein